MSDINEWIKLKYLVESIFGKNNRVTKTTAPILFEEGESPEVREIDGWKITVCYDVFGIVEFSYLVNFKEEVEKLGYEFVDYYLSLNDDNKGFNVVAIIIKKEGS